MTDTKTKWDELIYITNESNEIESMTYGDFVTTYGSDETTSPRGVAPRIHIRESEDDHWEVYYPTIGFTEPFATEDEAKESANNSEYDNQVSHICEIEYQVWSWGCGGNRPYYSGTSFDNEEEAENFVLECFEAYSQNRNDNTPSYYDTEEEADEERIERAMYNLGVDRDVLLSIERKEKVVKAARRAR